MDKSEFMHQFSTEEWEENLVDSIYDTFAGFCREENISEEEISNAELLEISRRMVELGVEEYTD